MKLAILILVVSFDCLAGDRIELQCPTAIEAGTSAWHVSEKPRDQSLRKIGYGKVSGFSRGAPEKLMLLAPLSTKTTNSMQREYVSTWGIGGGGIWYYCDYSSAKTRLSRPIPEGSKYCFIRRKAGVTQKAWCSRA